MKRVLLTLSPRSFAADLDLDLAAGCTDRDPIKLLAASLNVVFAGNAAGSAPPVPRAVSPPFIPPTLSLLPAAGDIDLPPPPPPPLAPSSLPLP